MQYINIDNHVTEQPQHVRLQAPFTSNREADQSKLAIPRSHKHSVMVVVGACKSVFLEKEQI